MVDNIVEGQVEYHVQLVVGKAKIAKSSKVPRNEMDSLVMLARLITAILPGMGEKPSSIMIIGDSKCTIQCVEAESKVLKDFFNNRCEEYDEMVLMWSHCTIHLVKKMLVTLLLKERQSGNMLMKVACGKMGPIT